MGGEVVRLSSQLHTGIAQRVVSSLSALPMGILKKRRLLFTDEMETR